MASISKIKIGTDVRDIHAVQLINERKITLSGSVTGTGYFDGSGDLTITTSTNHTHNYAGSSSAGGGAKKNESYQVGSVTTTYGNQWQVINQWITNDRLKIQVLNDGTVQSSYPIEVNHAYKLVDPSTAYNKTTALLNKGSATQPVYFSEGVPVVCTYSINATVPANAKFTDTIYTHPTTSGNKHIPSGGSSGQILRWSADGTAAWGSDNNTTYSAGTGLTLDGTTFKVTSANVSTMMNLLGEGTSPAQQDDYLIAQYAGGGTTTTTYHRRKVSNIITADNVKKALGTGTGTTKYLREDGTWVVPPNSNSAHSHSAGLGLTGSGSAGTSGTYTYKVNLVNETVASNAASYTAGGTSKFYAVQLDKNNKLGVYVPWSNTTYSSMSINEGTTGTATTSRVLTAANLKGIINAHAPTKTGSGASGTWGISITGSAGSVAWGNITGKPTSFAPSTHNHDSAYVNVTGDTMTGNLIIKGSNPYVGFQDSNGVTKGYVQYIQSSDTYALGAGSAKSLIVTNAGSIKIPASQTFTPETTNTGSVGTSSVKWNAMYATTFHGALNGNAATADKLNSSAGSSTKAIYFSGGKPVQCSDTIAHNITGYAASVSSKFSVDTSRYNQVITWYDSNGTTQHSYIGAHNTGNSTGAIIINPVKDSSKDNWSSDQGLYIGKTALKFWGSDIVTCEVVDTPPGVTTSTLYVAKSGDTMTGNLTAPKFIGALQGNADTATKANALTTARTISLTGDVTGSVSFNGSQNVTLTATVADDSHYHSGYMVKNPGYIEMMPGSSAGHGGYIDFHYNSSSADYTSRIIESASGTLSVNGASITGGKVYGAVWNDYAEYRICNEDFIPGQVVYEIGDDTMSITTKRLQRGCSIVSDTFGFVIGETDKAKCPVAVSGRVLAYGYESREEFKKHIGWPVCSGPNGTVSIMAEEEEEKYPSRIIGTISAVPDYEEWGTEKAKVNNRIWIKIK